MEHYDLVAEIAVVEKMSPVERLVHARKRRAHQLKQYRRYEKKLDKEFAKKRKPNSYSSSKKLTRTYNKRGVDFADNIKLLEAAARNDVDEVQELLMNNVNPDLTNEDGLTALHQCCIDESKKLMQLLLDFGANINARDSELWTPMHAAATCGHIRLCEILIHYNADLLAVNADGNMPYDICDDEDTLDLIENEMARRGITQEEIDETREAKERQMYNDLVEHVKQGKNLQDIRDHNGVTPLHIAAANGYLEVAKYLLDHKVPVNSRDDESWEPIHAAACWQESLMLDLLVEYGADIDSKTKKNDTPFDICDDPDIKQKILDMKDEQENQKRRSSGSVRKTNRPNNRSSSSSPTNCLLTSNNSFSDKALFRASLRRSSMRGEKSALFMKEAKEEAAHFGVIDLNSSNHIAEEDDDDDDEEDDYLGVTSVDDVELIMDDMKENKVPQLSGSVSQKSYQNGDTTNESNRLKSSDSFHSKISEVVLMTQSRSQGRDSPTVTSPSNTSTVNIPRQAPLTNSKESINSSKNSLKDSKKSIPLETNIDHAIKQVGSKSPDVSTLAKRFDTMSSYTNDSKPLETVLGRPVTNSNQSSKTSLKENRNPSAEVSQRKNSSNNIAASQSSENSSTVNWTLQVNKSANNSLKRQSNKKMVNGAELNEKSSSQSGKKAAPVKTPAAPSDKSESTKEPIPASRSAASKSSNISTPALSNSRLKDDKHGNSVKGSTNSDAASSKASNFGTSSTSRPIDVRIPFRNTDNTPSVPKGNDSANTQFEKGGGRDSKRKEKDSKSVHLEEKLPTNIPNELDNSSRPIPTSDTEGTPAVAKGLPQLEQRYPTNRTAGCTLSDLKRQRQANYNRRGSNGSGASTERLALTGENAKTILPNLPGNPSAHMQSNWQERHDSPALSSKFPAHAPGSADPTPATIGNYSTWSSSMSNGNDTITKYSAPSTVQVVGDEEKKCCCVIM
ncbi:protein phosphatase 1 regulatory subunit 12A isoform X2 [Octopus sinensis]|uniref:Protein phosphatase 1 regulatory subunit 12A isoform X2 n=1 Tax=Octopus sinensis TaxID=2607531 RepID=A0A7E6FHF2_9MOLL|nr:protein phosphatase 1 regulatory subunit 12A isoform X2 [Octopus sinensis]